MERIELQTQKHMVLDIMQRIHNVCVKNDLCYFLAYGTLIGAVRHKGFIPWDDDIDIWVPITEYDRFIDIIKNETAYKILDHRNDGRWLRCFSKISDSRTVMLDKNGKSMALTSYGISVDVFPLFPSIIDEKWGGRVLSCKRNLARFLKGGLGVYTGISHIPHRAMLQGLKMIGYDIFYWKEKLYEAEIENAGSDYLGSVISPYYLKDIHKKELFSEQCDLEFEGYCFKGPVGWNEILYNIYGDYMKLPPKEKRVTNHDEVAYWV